MNNSSVKNLLAILKSLREKRVSLPSEAASAKQWVKVSSFQPPIGDHRRVLWKNIKGLTLTKSFIDEVMAPLGIGIDYIRGPWGLKAMVELHRYREAHFALERAVAVRCAKAVNRWRANVRATEGAIKAMTNDMDRNGERWPEGMELLNILED